LEAVSNAILDAQGSYTQRQRIEIPGYYELWATYGNVKSNVVKLKIYGVVVDLPTQHKRSDIWMTMKLYADRAGDYDIYVAPNGDWSLEWKFFTLKVNEGGYAEQRIWYRPNVGVYWWDARFKTDSRYSAISWGASDFVEVIP
jgi:hypothetical protein